MRCYKFILALLSVCTVANCGKCKYQHEDEYVNAAVKKIASQFNVTECKAGQIYDFVVEGNTYFENAFKYAVDNSLTVKQCKKRCKLANTKIEAFLNLSSNKNILKGLGENININDLYEKCQSDCNVLPEMLFDIKKEEKEDQTKTKRDTCPAPSSGIINLVEIVSPYGIPKYQQASNSAETAITEVNGCGPKIFGKNIAESYQGLFLPACNCHDVCYDCQKGKEHCDDVFLTNLKYLCDAKIPDTKGFVNTILHAECYAKANIMYKAVDLFAQGSYDRCEKELNYSTKCAFCGASVVQNVLVSKPFYVQK